MAVAERSPNPSAGAAEGVLAITRLFDAPRAAVFAAFVDPRHARRWMGPSTHPATDAEADVRPGGSWRVCLRAIEGGPELWQGGVFREIVPGERLVYTFSWDQDDGTQGPETLVTITFADQGGKTLMSFRQAVFATVSNCDGHRIGWTSAFDRLDDWLHRRN